MSTYILNAPKDEHGQPRGFFNRKNNEAKLVDQLHGICTGILADGVVTVDEARFFNEWLKTNAALQPVFPLTDILARLNRIFADGQCDADEREELKEIMQAVCGCSGEKADPTATFSCTLPLDSPPPTLSFGRRIYNITGKFAFGTRKKVMEAISAKGGLPTDAPPTLDSHYLLIGTFASRDWVNTSFGRKIEKAVAIRKSGAGIAIISEEHWRTVID